MGFLDQKVQQLKQEIIEISANELEAFTQANSSVIVDVREKEELESGMIEHALHIPKSLLELKAETELTQLSQSIILVCGSGVRSLFAADSLRAMGYMNISSLKGGMQAWKDLGLPVSRPKMLDLESRQRYLRHTLIPEIGENGQLKLLDSRVLLVGAGGLGSPAALYLAAAGVGTLGIIDSDVVEVSNLQRQVIHGESYLGKKKVLSAASRISELNPQVNVVTYDAMLDEDNVDELFSQYDLVIDGCDNFNTRYLINDACVKHGIANVHGAVFRFDGYLTVFSGHQSAPCYRCIYPSPPPSELAPSCMEAGVMGVLPGVIGILQAVEAIKLLLNLGEPLTNRILRYDALDAEFTELEIEHDPNCPVCSVNADAIQYQNFDTSCSL
ncbi:molybdopterin-synthase adenylyltransferase MoeB [Pseudoalteromonas sp. MTN2-4]|uniref:molybdopterin-synthase adenylyltransferase MoeB n=1 Tax=Pseudoalteromonas sp. MTN2-4 TaxID=3056555 RepID=UPI0036F37004